MYVFHLKNCQRLVRINQKILCCSAVMYKVRQQNTKFLVVYVKNHMKTDVLIIPMLGHKGTLTLPFWPIFGSNKSCINKLRKNNAFIKTMNVIISPMKKLRLSFHSATMSLNILEKIVIIVWEQKNNHGKYYPGGSKKKSECFLFLVKLLIIFHTVF